MIRARRVAAAVALLVGVGGGWIASQPGPGGASERAEIPPVFLSDLAARRLGVGPGAQIDLAISPGGPWHPARVVRVYRPARYPTELGQEEIGVRLHLPDLQALAGRGDQVDSIVVRLRDPASASGVVERLNAASLGFRAYTSTDLAAQSSSTFEVITRFHRAIGIVTILASSVFLVAIMTLRGEAMQQQAGILRLLGVSPRTVAGTTLLVAAGVALLGSGIGIGLGFLLSVGINACYQRLFDTALVFSRITPPLVGVATILSALLGVAAGAVAAWRLLRRTPLDQVGR